MWFDDPLLDDLDEELDEWAEETDLVNDLVDKYNNIIKQEEEN